MTARGLLLAAIVAAGLTACGGDDGAETESSGTDATTSGVDASDVVVRINTFQYQPDPIKVDVGTTITWENEDRIDHTVTAGTREAPEPDQFRGELLERDTTFEFDFDEPGTYDYFCEIHSGPGMTGRVIVE